MVRDLRDVRAAAGPDELAAFETDVLAGFVLARAAAGLSDGTMQLGRLCRAQLVEYGEELVDPLAGNVSQVLGKTLPVFGGWYLSWRQG